MRFDSSEFDDDDFMNDVYNFDDSEEQEDTLDEIAETAKEVAEEVKGNVSDIAEKTSDAVNEAVENAIGNQLSVIQGPPGTGKTQTILNIIANLLVAGKTVQIVSNNNSAVENVQEKLDSDKYNLGFIVAKLGKGENKKQFIE